jgi:hypothetical protein
MLEARTFVDNFDRAKEILKSEGAIFKGEYEIHDIIFSPKDPAKTLSQEFLRLRLVPKNIWNEKEVIVAIKNTEVRKVGKDVTVPLKREFDSREEAEKFISENLLDRFEYAYEFGRVGWQYDLGEDQVDLEDIEGHHSIEIKSKTEEGLEELADLFSITDTLNGPLVASMKHILRK